MRKRSYKRESILVIHFKIFFIFQCMACGPEGKGRCAGPNICCQKEGCVIGDMAKECMQEDEGTTVCEVKGIPCGAEGQGRCVADGVCCDTCKLFKH